MFQGSIPRTDKKVIDFDDSKTKIACDKLFCTKQGTEPSFCVFGGVDSSVKSHRIAAHSGPGRTAYGLAQNLSSNDIKFVLDGKCVAQHFGEN